MARLTRSLLGGIRSVAEHKSKSESSQALMDTLRSKSHMYHIIRTIRVVSHGPEMLVDLMLQQRIPSVIIKLFRSFIDLPPDYYNSDQAPPTTDSNDTKDTPENADMVSLQEIGTIITDTLKRFAQNKSVIRRLIVEDTFSMMVRLMSVKPSEWHTYIPSNEEPKYMVWKQRALEVLKLVQLTSDVCQYLKSRGCIETLVQVWNDCASKAQINSLDLYEVLLSLDLVIYLLKHRIIMAFMISSIKAQHIIR
ncbi:hypothetical protein BX666DRAFT_1514511 [Dichotomocladium elegans]|nr:hypothetical protein BX666DRAFT_1514511 [Dichotomocladium elegans]